MREDGTIWNYGMLVDALDRAWRELHEKGSSTIQPGLFLEWGRDIPRGDGEEPLDPESCYLTTDSGTEPIWTGSFDDLFEALVDILCLED